MFAWDNTKNKNSRRHGSVLSSIRRHCTTWTWDGQSWKNCDVANRKGRFFVHDACFLRFFSHFPTPVIFCLSPNSCRVRHFPTGFLCMALKVYCRLLLLTLDAGQQSDGREPCLGDKVAVWICEEYAKVDRIDRGVCCQGASRRTKREGETTRQETDEQANVQERL